MSRENRSQRASNATHHTTASHAPPPSAPLPEKPIRSILREKFVEPALYISLIALAVAIRSCSISQDTANRSKDQLHIDIQRQYGTESIDTSYGFPAIKVRWIADITNMSEEGASISQPLFMVIDQDGRLISNALPPIKPNQEPVGPISIEPKKTLRLTNEAIIPLPQQAALLVANRGFQTFQEWSTFAKGNNLNELGLPSNGTENVQMEVYIRATDGAEFMATGSWFPKPYPGN